MIQKICISNRTHERLRNAGLRHRYVFMDMLINKALDALEEVELTGSD